MAAKKISELPAAATVTGADLIPIVQGGATVQATAAGLPVSTASQAALDVVESRALVQPWVTGTAYKLGQEVSSGGTNYLALANHTSGATFAGDSASWVARASGTAAPTLINGGSLGAAYALNCAGAYHVWLHSCVLTANCTITVTNMPAGGRVLLLGVQDATGGRTLSISDGVTPAVLDIATGANAPFKVHVDSPDGSTLIADVAGGGDYVVNADPRLSDQRVPTDASVTFAKQATVVRRAAPFRIPRIPGKWHRPIAGGILDLYAFPFASLNGAGNWEDEPVVIDEIGTHLVTAGSAGCLIRLGIYLPSVTIPGYPGGVYLDAGTVPGDVAGYPTIVLTGLAANLRTIPAGLSILTALSTGTGTPPTLGCTRNGPNVGVAAVATCLATANPGFISNPLQTVFPATWPVPNGQARSVNMAFKVAA